MVVASGDGHPFQSTMPDPSAAWTPRPEPPRTGLRRVRLVDWNGWPAAAATDEAKRNQPLAASEAGGERMRWLMSETG